MRGGKKGRGWGCWSRMLNSESNILLDLFVWSRPNAIIRSTFSTVWRKRASGERDEDHDQGLARHRTWERIFFLRGEGWNGGRRWKKRRQGFRILWKWLASRGRKPAAGQMYQPASVSLLLKVVYQCVSSCDVTDLVDFDWSNSYWKTDCCHCRVFICRNHLLGRVFNDVWFWWECQWSVIKICSAVGGVFVTKRVKVI